jgi:hypothetical protein
MTNYEVDYIVDALEDLAKNHKEWALDYEYDHKNNEFFYAKGDDSQVDPSSWFDISLRKEETINK